MPDRVPHPTKFSSRPVMPIHKRLFRQRRFWLQLASYRPLGILAGIWVALLVIAFLAFGQLTHNASDGQPAPSTVETYPHERFNGMAETPSPAPEATPERDDSPLSETESLATQTVQGLSVWTLAALVGSCAGGCWLLSMLVKMPRRPPKRRSPRANSGKKYRLAAPKPTSVAASSSLSPTAKAPGVPKLATYDPQQPLVAPASTPPQSAEPRKAAEAEVALVADDVQHRLDWPSDSLVNTADVRQRRSLSSYL